MDLDGFWRLVDTARAESEDDDDFLVRIDEALRAMPDTDDVMGFERELEGLLAKSYTWELWGAAYLINGGCSDDGFDYFRAWLIAQGRTVFEAALANPDSLADLDAADVELEDFLYVASEAYEDRTGDEIRDEAYLQPPLAELRQTFDFENDDEMKTRYPKLWTKLMSYSDLTEPE